MERSTDLETGDPLIGATVYFEELKKGYRHGCGWPLQYGGQTGQIYR